MKYPLTPGQALREVPDPELSLTPAKFVDGLIQADAEFERKRGDYFILLRALANAVYRAKLPSGCHLCDATDFQQWLALLAEAMK